MNIKLADNTEIAIVQKSIVQDKTLQFTLQTNDIAIVDKLKEKANLEKITEIIDENTTEYAGYLNLKSLTIKPDLKSKVFYINVVLEKNEYYNELQQIKEELEEKNKQIEALTKEVDSMTNDCTAIMDMIDELVCDIIPMTE